MKKAFAILLLCIFALAPAYWSASTGGGGKAPFRPTFNEAKLQCSSSETMKERILCRYSLEENYSELNFLPEECRSLQDEKRENCLKLYESVRPCWKMEKHSQRENCLMQKIGLREVKSEKQECADIECLYALREKVFSLAKLRIYNLEERAEEMEKLGVSKDAIIDIVVKLEEDKISFNSAQNIDQKKAVLVRASEKWKKFRAQAVKEIKAKKGEKQ